ncbi:hypothetical protein LJC45_00385 [Alistipes sp. OttesenSCG-928-B03]|nr:hypothetical protein [Alistipes sp. OttesenSCG-928-B03]
MNPASRMAVRIPYALKRLSTSAKNDHKTFAHLIQLHIPATQSFRRHSMNGL